MKQVSPQTTWKNVQVDPRATLKGEVLIHDDENLYIAPLENLSAGGAFIGKLISMPMGKAVSVVIRTGDFSPPVQARGYIVRVERNLLKGTAIKFHFISALDKMRVEECIKQHQDQDHCLRIA